MINYFPGKRRISKHDCFIHNGKSYFAVTLSVYEGGKVECWGPMNKEEFLEKVNAGWITVDLPDGVELRIGEQDFIVKQAETLNRDGTLMFKHKWITKESFIMAVLDSIDVSLGNKSASEMCHEAFAEFCIVSSEENKKKLHSAYLNVAEHKRAYILGDQDLKDFPIRRALGI